MLSYRMLLPALVLFCVPAMGADEASVEQVLRNLNHPDPEVLERALRQITDLESDAPTARVVALLEHDDPGVRRAAVLAMYDLSPEDHLAPLMALLDDPDESTRRLATSLLGGISDPRAVEAVVDQLVEQDEEAFDGVLSSLVFGGAGPLATPIVIRRAEQATDPEQITRYLRALARFVPEDADNRHELESLRSLLDHPEADVQLAAARMFRNSDEPRTHRALLGLLERDDPADVVEAASILLTGERPIPRRAVARLLENPSPEARRLAVDLAMRLGEADRRSVLRLRLAAPETDDLVTAKLASAIADIAGPEEVDWLLGLGRETESQHVRVNAILALGRSEYRIGSRKSPPWFRTIIENRDAADTTLIAVAVALRDVGDFSFVPPLSTRLRQDADLSPVVGEEFVQTIGLLLGRRLHGDTFGRPEDDS